jgi:hypothetical protein
MSPTAMKLAPDIVAVSRIGGAEVSIRTVWGPVSLQWKVVTRHGRGSDNALAAKSAVGAVASPLFFFEANATVPYGVGSSTVVMLHLHLIGTAVDQATTPRTQYHVQELHSGVSFTVDLRGGTAGVTADSLDSLVHRAGIRSTTVRLASSTEHAVVLVGLAPGQYSFIAGPGLAPAVRVTEQLLS